MKIKLIYILAFFAFGHLLAQNNPADSLLNLPVPENEVIEEKHFWKEGFYKDYPIEKNKNSEIENNFDTFSAPYQNNPEFNYGEKKLVDDSFWHRLGRKIEDFFNRFDILPKMDMYDWMVNALKILGVLAIVYILYRLLISNNSPFFRPKKETEEDPNSLKYIEKNLMNIELQEYINEAIKTKNYPLAIRYLHLENVKKLAQKELIQWEYQKTNRELINEIENENLRKQFQENTLIFNEIWFGSREVSAEDFGQYQEMFNQLNRQI